MKKHIAILAIVLLPLAVSAQPDSLERAFRTTPDGQDRFILARFIYNYYEETNRDSALFYANEGLAVAQRSNHKIAAGYSLVNKSYQLIGLGRLGAALQCILQAFAIAEDPKNETDPHWDITTANFPGNNRLLVLSYAHHMYGLLMVATENPQQQIYHFREALRIGTQINYRPRMMLASMNLGRGFLLINNTDSALYYERQAENIAIETGFTKYVGTVQLHLGDIYQGLGKTAIANQYYYRGIRLSEEVSNLPALSRNYLRMIRYHLATANRDSALYYSRKNVETIRALGQVNGIETNMGVGYEMMYRSFRLNNEKDSAYKYLTLTLSTKDSLTRLRIGALSDFQNLSFGEQLRLQDLEKDRIAYQNRVRIYILSGGIAVLLLLGLIIYRNNRQKSKARRQIEQAYHELKATQSQLIQSEKMASLGELTAGIAHEIQNPLNFVTNFSEVSKELIDEMKTALDRSDTAEAKSIAGDLQQNLDKILHHGRRADGIVKGMLQHSRSGSGQKEPTDINALADEYVRLAYHGLRAKDKSFNAKFEIATDPAVGLVNVVTQDIGRVILNLINNAFYAVSEKKKSAASDYEPTVTVSTKKINGTVQIRVIDNGNGIPQKVIDKIFQPFFTTKPTGEGTGLGLSLSYDIVTKGHAGKLEVRTTENIGTEFIITLPVA
jgi:two-component system NtrC family sensor kinase